MEKILLNTNASIPIICFGPGMLSRNLHSRKTFIGKLEYKFSYKKAEYCYYKAICNALELGYRFIDYSAAYGREDLLNKAVHSSGVDRKDLFLTTRISNQAQYKNEVRKEFFTSLKRYGTEYIDILMFHWPVSDHFLSTLEEMIKLKEEGYCKSIGVANCNIHHINEIIKQFGIIPAINQVEIHPLFTQKELVKYCQKNGIVVEAYTPLARFDERIVRLPLLKKISEKHSKSIAQIILRWHIQNKIIPVFRSMNKKRLKENLNVFDFNLSLHEMQLIDGININSRLRYDPDNCDFTIL